MHLPKETKHNELSLEEWGEDEDRQIRCFLLQRMKTLYKPIQNFQTHQLGQALSTPRTKKQGAQIASL